MQLFRGLQSALLLRSVLKSVKGIETALVTQNTLLARLADKFAPVYDESVQARASVDFVSPIEVALTDAFSERTMREQGRAPTDDEIQRFLDDERTIDLRQQLEQVP